MRRRDAVFWLILLGGFIMLLPSALAIAQPIENPSHTRASGALPSVFLMAAFGLTGLTLIVLRWMPRRGVWVSAALFTVLSALIYSANFAAAYTPSGSYRQNYLQSGLPHSVAGRIVRAFMDSDGAATNAFILAYPYWWDHRAVGIEAGLTPGAWRNTITDGQDLMAFLFDAANHTVNDLRLDVDRDLLFFYAEQDTAQAVDLAVWFPQGRAVFHDMSDYMPGRSFYTFRVPALGHDGFSALMAEHDRVWPPE